MNAIRAFVGITAYLAFFALVVTFIVAGFTGGELTDGELDGITEFFAPIVVVYLILLKLLESEKPRKRPRR